MLSSTEIEKFGPSHVRRVFGKLFIPYASKRITKGGVLQHYFYTTEHAVIFPPVSDKPDSLDLESIQSVVRYALPILFAMPELFTKQWIFPVAQERVLNKITRNNRDHWVVLHYNPLTGDSLVLDSAYKVVAQFYDNNFILQDLTAALEIINQEELTSKLEIKKFDTLFLSAQNMLDYVSCGAWATITIDALAKGTSLEQHQRNMSQLTKQGAADLLLTYKQLASVTLVTDIAASLDDVDEFGLNEHAVDDVFSEELQNSWHTQTIQHFREIIRDPGQIMNGLIDLEAISLGDIKIKPSNAELLTQYSLELISELLDNNYRGFRNCDINSTTQVHDLCSFSVDDRVIGMFRKLKFSPESINEFKLSDILKYVSAIYLASIKYNKFYSLLLTPMGEGVVPQSMLDEKDRFTSRVYDSIKPVILTHQACPKTNVTLFKPAATASTEQEVNSNGKPASCVIS